MREQYAHCPWVDACRNQQQPRKSSGDDLDTPTEYSSCPLLTIVCVVNTDIHMASFLTQIYLFCDGVSSPQSFPLRLSLSVLSASSPHRFFSSMLFNDRLFLFFYLLPSRHCLNWANCPVSAACLVFFLFCVHVRFLLRPTPDAAADQCMMYGVLLLPLLAAPAGKPPTQLPR